MLPSDVEIPAGLPMGTAPIPASVPQPQSNAEHWRCPTDEPGLPISAVTCEALSDGDRRALEDQRRERLAQIARDSIRNADSMRSLGYLLSPLRTLVVGLVVLALLACTLFVFSHTIQALVLLNSFAPPLRYTGYGLLAVLGAAVVVYIARFFYTIYRLRENRQVCIAELHVLRERRELQELADKGEVEARTHLLKWLTDYRIDETQRRLLESCGLAKEDVSGLTRVQQELQASTSAWGHWSAKFVTDFQDPLDRAADKAIRDFALMVGAKTAVSQNALIDTAVIIYSGFGLLTTLCQIYQLRAGVVAMTGLAGQVLAQAYLAGRLEDAPVEDWLSSGINRSLAALGSVHLPVIGNTAAALGAPALQALINGKLICRIGSTTQRMLRPIRQGSALNGR